MKRFMFHFGIALASTLLTLNLLVSVVAQTALEPKLTIDQVRLITDQQFVRLHNDGQTAVNLAEYELFYSSTSGSNKMFSLPILLLEAGESYIMSEGTMNMCYPAYVDNVSLGFAAGSSATTGGALQLWRYADAAKLAKVRVDEVSWRNKIPLVSDITKLPDDSDSLYFRKLPEGSAAGWQAVAPDPNDACGLIGFNESSPPPINDEFVFVPGSLPAVKYLQSGAGDNTKTANRNRGKSAPIINEILPNPASPQTDAADEFVELYNPNSSEFDLTGFKLAFGSNNPKKYTFPEGTVLGPKEFKAFTSGDTSISLSNEQAQVWLLDPNEKIIGQSELYSKAKDGQAWALNGGKWVWTLLPTPNAMNTISTAVTATEKAKTAASTLGIKSTASTSAGEPASGSDNESSTTNPGTLHPGVLAAVGIAAVAYSIYEYRQDMSNQIFRARRYLSRRQALRRQA